MGQNWHPVQKKGGHTITQHSVAVQADEDKLTEGGFEQPTPQPCLYQLHEAEDPLHGRGRQGRARSIFSRRAVWGQEAQASWSRKKASALALKCFPEHMPLTTGHLPFFPLPLHMPLPAS
eukprot:gene19864-biopygen827